MGDFITQLFIFPFFMVFVRLGAMMMVLPAVSDGAVSPRIRLLAGLSIAFLMYPALIDKIPDVPDSTPVMIVMVLGEILIGVMMAIGARLFLATMALAGDMISFMSGFQAATLFDPRLGGMSTAPATFLTIMASLLVFATGLHLWMLQAVFESYDVLPIGQIPPMGDALASIVNLLGAIYVIGVKLAAPVVTVGFLTYMGFGLLNRLVPQVQAFFIALPLTLSLGLFVLGVSLASMVTLFSDEVFNYAILFTQTQP